MDSFPLEVHIVIVVRERRIQIMPQILRAHPAVGPGPVSVVRAVLIHTAGTGEVQHTGKPCGIPGLGSSEDFHHLRFPVLVQFSGGDLGHSADLRILIESRGETVSQRHIAFDPEFIMVFRQGGYGKQAYDQEEGKQRYHPPFSRHCSHVFPL